MTTTHLILCQYIKNPQYNDVIGKVYHFPKKYLNYFNGDLIEFLYYEPGKNGNGEYFGKGKIKLAPKQDRFSKGHFLIEIEEYTPFPKPVQGPKEPAPFYKPQNAVRRIDPGPFSAICKEGLSPLPTPKNEAQIRFNPHILRLLGDQLIGRDELAVFELVKNSYDADATRAEVILEFDTDDPKIRVRDDGLGMDEDAIRNGWLTVGGETKRKSENQRTSLFNRLQLGEKGVGRLAAFKLGNRIRLATRKKDGSEFLVELDIDDLEERAAQEKDASLSVSIISRQEAISFPGDSYGTEVSISQLRRTDWQRGQVRSLQRTLNSLCSPFNTPDSFQIELSVPGREVWLENLFSLEDILNAAVWKFDFSISSEGAYDWTYSFIPPNIVGVEASFEEKNNDVLPLIEAALNTGRMRRQRIQPAIILSKEDLHGIGPIRGKLRVYHRRDEIFRSKQLKEYLDEQVGIRLYRDGIRVHDYGEPRNDWLGLDAYRIDRPGGRLANNSVIGMIELTMEGSFHLREKTNREGFDDNTAFWMLRNILLSVVDHLDRKRISDRIALAKALKGKPTFSKEPGESGNARFGRAISEIETVLRKDPNLEKHIESLNAIRSEYLELQEVMVQAGMAGLNLALIFHEVERGVADLESAVKIGEDKETIEKQIGALARILEGFASLFKKNERKNFWASSLLERARSISAGRFRFHKIQFLCPILENETADFQVKGIFGLILGAVNNLIANSIYWTRRRCETEKGNYEPKITILAFPETETKAASIVVADNGTGFLIDPKKACDPFYTERPGGMGLGLYYARLVMETQGGSLQIEDIGDYDLPPGFTQGAVVSLTFGKGRSKV